jgi:hypothetical protein
MSTNEKQPNNILSMIRKKTVSPMPSLDKIEQYWNLVRSNRLVPSRAEIDPRGLEGVLSHAFILERITGGLARFRIAGSHINDLTGLELRQMPISALFLPNSRQILSDALVAVFEEPSMVRLRIESKGGFGREKMTGEMILLPLRSDTGQIDRVLGGIVMDGKIGRTPRRIEILGQSRQSLVGYAGSQHAPANEVPNPKATPKAPLAPMNRSVETPKAPLPERGHLRLVIDND